MQYLTEVKQSSKNLKNYKILFFILLCLAVKSTAQELVFKRAVPILSPQKVSLDRYNFAYVNDEKGNIFKISPEGELIQTYSPQKKGDVTLLDAWRNVNIFVFYRSFQEFVILDRFMNPSPHIRFERERVGFVQMAAYSSDNNLWVLDNDDFSLKKYNLENTLILQKTSLDLILDPRTYDLNYMREYQNYLFVNDKNSGVLIFDNLGNYKSTMPIKGLNFFSFINNEIYFLQNNTIILRDLYSSKERSIALPAGKEYIHALIGDKIMYLFTKEGMEIYEM
jgi:hypothetical protein